MKKEILASRSFYVVVFLTILMIWLGGLTRLTHSGLSITEWKPIMGALPPLSAHQWEVSFEKYKKTPEYLKINHGMTLSEFKFIFFMEWAHRFLGRLIGLALLVPFVLFWMRRELDRALLGKFLTLFALLGVQGFLGWFMVRSGLVDIPRVSAYRLVIHLDAALLFLSVAYLFANAGSSGPAKSGFYKVASVIVLLIIGVQIDLGGFTAGLRAGHVSNTFPLMNGQWIPNGVAAFEPFIRNLFENPVTVHFLHRNFAYVAVLASILFGIYGLLRESTSRREKVWLIHIAVLAGLQAVLGVSVVVFQVPVLLASFHQMIAVGMWLAALYLVFAAFRKNKP